MTRNNGRHEWQGHEDLFTYITDNYTHADGSPLTRDEVAGFIATDPLARDAVVRGRILRSFVYHIGDEIAEIASYFEKEDEE
jgi:hypothetical protein